MLKLTKIMHFFEEDKDCGGDYLGVEIFLNDSDTPLVTYGDYYHDNGREKAEGFIEGFQKAFGILSSDSELQVEEKLVADSNDCGEW